ncbi:hypothetical protein [Thiolapillus brandeum]|nr:hypothetical protein [Thiolapillus brandeum]
MRRLVLAAMMVGTTAATADEVSSYQTARKQGVKTCLEKVKEVGNFLVGDHNHASHDVWNTVDTDKRMFSSFLVKEYSDGDTHISMIVGPDATGKCFAEYNETTFWSKSCSIIREEVFSEFKFAGSMKEATIVLKNKEDSVNAYLTPQSNGNACLSTRREVVFY